MSVEAVAGRYARAVFELAKESGKVQDDLKQLGAFADAYQASSDLRTLENTPAIDDAQRAAIIEALGKRLNASAGVVRVVTLLTERRRLAVLPELVRQLEQMADDHLGILRADVRSAKALPESYRSRLKQELERATGKKVIVNYQEDAALIAGVVTQIGDRVVDGSVRGKLAGLAESLRQN